MPAVLQPAIFTTPISGRRGNLLALHGPISACSLALSPNKKEQQIAKKNSLWAPQVKSTVRAWDSFVGVFERKESAADAIYGAFFDAAPNLQGMFRAARHES